MGCIQVLCQKITQLKRQEASMKQMRMMTLLQRRQCLLMSMEGNLKIMQCWQVWARQKSEQQRNMRATQRCLTKTRVRIRFRMVSPPSQQMNPLLMLIKIRLLRSYSSWRARCRMPKFGNQYHLLFHLPPQQGDQLQLLLFQSKMREDNKYQILKKVGEGAYGAVFKAKNTHHEFVAIKVIKFDRDDHGVPSTALREISILKSLTHPNIVKLLDVEIGENEGTNELRLVFEFLDEDLGKLIKRELGQPEEKYKDIFVQIVKAVEYMHNRQILHRDLKPQNVLCSFDGKVKVADFGLSRIIINSNRTHSKEIQTLWYRSPQLLLGSRHYDGGVDMWSLGCILYELAEGKVLFKGDCEVSQIFEIFKVLGTPKKAIWPGVVALPHFKKLFPKMSGTGIELKNISEDGADLINCLLQMDPQKRIKIEEVLEHPFVSRKDKKKQAFKTVNSQ